MKKINIYGLGYIGLPTAALLADYNHSVLGIDISPDVVETINRGEVHIVEPQLDALVKKGVASGSLRAALKPELGDVHIIAVPTPFKGDHEPDVTYVESATKTVCEVVKEGDLVILESTSPVGTTELVAQIIKEHKPELNNIFVAHSPERVIPGHVIRELVENDRVIGGVDEKSTKKAIEFYESFVKGRVLKTNARTAEMCKLTENSFRDVNIAFANELSIICDELDIDVWELIKLANHHPRVNVLQPGPGVGGHCIAVDPWFIVNASPQAAKLIRQAREVNDSKPSWVIEQVTKQACKFKEPVIACLGAAFKANIDDLRESPSLSIIHQLQKADIGEVLTVEPNVNQLDGTKLVSLDSAIEKADILVVLVDHDEFVNIDEEKIMTKCIIDTKGIL
jgi:UDP-N-acetyl-D-mannosaminuronic acid dehydrogenase